jgi:hypothetical protein
VPPEQPDGTPQNEGHPQDSRPPCVAPVNGLSTSRDSEAIKEQLTNLLQQSGEGCNRVASMCSDTMDETNKSPFSGLYGEVPAQGSGKQMMLLPMLSVMLLVLASCGDFQDPSTDQAGNSTPIVTPQGEPLTYPIGGNEGAQAAAEAGMNDIPNGVPQPGEENSGDSTAVPVSAPSPMDLSYPLGVPAATQSSTEADLPVSAPLQSEQTQPLPATQSQQLPWASSSGTQPAFVQDPGAIPKIVTIGWDPPVTPDVLGYKVLILSASGFTYSRVVIAPMTELKLALPRGQSYLVTVTAFNSGGESPPATYVPFDLL